MCTNMGLCMKILEGFVISVNDHGLTCQITPPLHAKLEYGQKFSISGALILFCTMELLAPKTHRAQYPLIGLHQGGSNSCCTGVSSDNKVTIEVGKNQHRGTTQRLSQSLETCLLRVSPDKRAVFAQQPRDWCGQVSKVVNEPVIVICEA